MNRQIESLSAIGRLPLALTLALTLATTCLPLWVSALAPAQSEPAAAAPAAPTPVQAEENVEHVRAIVDVPSHFFRAKTGTRFSPFEEWLNAANPPTTCSAMVALNQVWVRGLPGEVKDTVEQLNAVLVTYGTIAAQAAVEAAAANNQFQAERADQRQNSEMARERKRLTVEWAGGTFRQFAEAASQKWQHANHEPLNILFATPDLGDVPVPGLQVAGVSPMTLLTSAAALASGADAIRTFSVREIEGGSLTTEAVFLVSASTFTPDSTTPPTRVKVFRLEDWGIDAAQVPAILEALAISFEMQGAADAVSARFHEGTGLLFVKIPGDTDSELTLDQVMSQLLR